MSRAACPACAKDRARQQSAVPRGATWFQPGAAEACARMRSSARQWWERAPGWFREAIREPAPPTYSPPAYGTPVCRMKPAQLVAELTRQSARLSRALVGDYAGPRAAEEYVLARRVELGLNHLQEVAA